MTSQRLDESFIVLDQREKNPSFQNINNIFLSPQTKLLYNKKIKLLYCMQTSSYSLSSLKNFYMLLTYGKRASMAHNPLK